MNKLCSLLSCWILILLMFSVSAAKAATITSTATGGDWATGSTWVGGNVPATTDSVVIASGATVSINSTQTCGGLQITGTLSIAYTYTLNVDGGGTSPATFGCIGGSGTISGSGYDNITLYGDWSFSGTTTNTQLAVYFYGGITRPGNTSYQVVSKVPANGFRNIFISQNSSTTLYFNVTPTYTNYVHINTIGPVVYNGVAQTVLLTTGGGTYAYYTNLTLAGSGIKTTTNVTVDGVLSMEGTATISAAPTYGAAATLQYNKPASFTSDVEWPATFSGTGGVIIENTGAITLNGAKILSSGVPLTIDAGATLNTSTTNTYTLTVGGTTSVSGTLTIANTGTKTFTGAVTINSGGAITETAAATLSFGSDVTINGTLTENGAATVGIAGSFTDNGTYTASTGTHTFSGTTKTIGGTSAISIPTATFTGTYTNSGTLTVGTLLTVTSPGVLTNTGTITATTALSGTGGLTQGTTGILNIGGTSGITTLTATATGNTVNYNGAAQTGKVTTYYNLTLSGSGIKTFATTPTVNGILSMEGTATITVTTGVVTYGANATLQYNTSTSRTASSEEWITPFAGTGGIIIENTGTITLNAAKVLNSGVPLTISVGATLNTSTTNTYTLTVGGTTSVSGTLTIANTGTQTFTGAVTIASGGAITENGAATVGFAGNLTDNGTYTASTGVHSFTGTNKTISGTSAISIPTATFTGTYTNSGTLTVGTLLTVTSPGTLTNTGTITATTALSGTGSLTQGTTGILNIGGTSGITTLDASTNAGNTVNYTGASQTIHSNNYYNLTLSGSGTDVLQSGTTVIGGNFTLSGTVSTTLVAGITITGNLVIGSGNILTIPPAPTGELTVNGTSSTLGGSNCMVIQSTSSGTGSFIDHGITGTGAQVQHYLTGGATTGSTNYWHGISSPITNATSNVFLGEYLMYYTEGTNAYTYIAPTNTSLNPMKGYFTWVNPTTTVNFSGPLNTGDMSIGVTRTYISGLGNGPYNGWNLIGNPYPSSIDFSLFMSSTNWSNVDQAAYIWSPGGGNYLVYPVGGNGTHSSICPPEQAFFVHCNASASQGTPGNGTVYFKNAARIHSTETFLKSDTIIPNLLRIRAQTSTNSYYDELTVYFDPSRTNYYEPGYDALKYSGNADAPQIYTLINDTAVTVNSMVFDQKNITVPMGFNISVPGMYTLNASNLEDFGNSISVHLEDLKLNVTQDLKLNPVYTFNYDTTDAPNRFILHFDNPSFGVNDLKDVKPVQIYSYGNSIYIDALNGKTLEGNVFVYDLLGKELYQGSLPDQQLTKLNLNLAEGYYIVKVVTAQGVYMGKVYLK
jgi:hypothetical protein